MQQDYSALVQVKQDHDVPNLFENMWRFFAQVRPYLSQVARMLDP